MNDSEYARKAYFELRHAVAEGSKPLPPWDGLKLIERELLTRMFIAGATWMGNAIRADAKEAAE